MIQRQIPLYRLDAIKDEKLPSSIESLAPYGDYSAHIFENCPVYYAGESNQLTIPFNGIVENEPEDGTKITRLSPIHVRSFEVNDSRLPEVWHDEYGHPYTSVNLKGNNFSNAKLIETLTASEGLIAFGLQESATIRRIVKGSNILRAAGISTEYIMGVGEPKYYPTPVTGNDIDWHKNLTRDEYKNKLINNYWESLPEENRTAESLAELYTKFNRMTFYITLRGMDTSYRIGELDDPVVLNKVLGAASKIGYDKNEKIDSEDSKDLDWLIKEITIPRLATNFFKLHKERLAHKFPVADNLTALGSIIDLDSLHGEPLDIGDSPITVDDIITDLKEVCDSLGQINVSIGSYEFRYDYINQFLDLYYELYKNHESEMPFAIKQIGINALNGVKKETDEDFWHLLNLLPNSLKPIEEKFLGELDEYLLKQMNYSLNTWSEEVEDDVIKELLGKIDQKTIESLVDLVVTEAHSNKRLDEDLFDDFLTNPDIYSSSGEYYFEIITELVKTSFLEYCENNDYGEFNSLEEIEKKKLFEKLVTSNNIFKRFSDIFVENYREKYAEDFKCHVVQSIIPGIEIGIGNQHVYGNLFTIQNHSINLSTLFEACDKNNVEVFITQYDDPRGSVHSKKILDGEDPDTFIASDGYYIRETLTDGEITLSAYPLESELDRLYVELSSDATYVAFLEQNDEGDRKLTLQIVIDRSDWDKDWDTLPGNLKAQYLVNKYLHQDKLFDDKIYIKSEPKEIII
jgi:hypothetical protein